jgi:hypothetical protein
MCYVHLVMSASYGMSARRFSLLSGFVFVIASFLTAAQPAFSQEAPCNQPLATTSDCDLKGPVHMAESWSSISEDRSPALRKLPSRHTFLTFSAEGKIIENRIESKGALESRTRYTVTDGGQTVIVESDGGTSHGQGMNQAEQVLSYDEQEHLILRQTRSNKGILQDTERNTFDDAGHKLSQDYYSADGRLSEHIEYSYDDQGRLVRECHPSMGYFEYQYPASNQERKLYISSDGACDRQMSAAVPRWVIDTAYDNSGRALIEVSSGAGAKGYESWLWPYRSPEAGRVVKSFDKQGRLLDQTDYATNGDIEFTESDRYDGAGNMISETVNGAGLAEARRFQYSYEFDDYGNWVQKITYALGPDGSRKVLEVDYRKIAYYDN